MVFINLLLLDWLLWFVLVMHAVKYRVMLQDGSVVAKSPEVGLELYINEGILIQTFLFVPQRLIACLSWLKLLHKYCICKALRTNTNCFSLVFS